MSRRSTVGVVLRRPIYAIVAAIISIALGALFWYLTFSFTPLPDYIKMYGLPFTVTTVALGSVIAVLTGINSSMVICRKQMTGSLGFKKSPSASACGAFTGAVASGCPVCTAPLLGVFGLAGALAVFPLQGLELKMAAIVALAVSVYFTAKNVKTACKM
jgi:hypothetical protein